MASYVLNKIGWTTISLFEFVSVLLYFINLGNFLNLKIL